MKERMGSKTEFMGWDKRKVEKENRRKKEKKKSKTFTSETETKRHCLSWNQGDYKKVQKILGCSS